PSRTRTCSLTTACSSRCGTRSKQRSAGKRRARRDPGPFYFVRTHRRDARDAEKSRRRPAAIRKEKGGVPLRFSALLRPRRYVFQRPLVGRWSYFSRVTI